MSACTFFGHRECPESVKPALRLVLEDLILRGVEMFYVGNQGQFDAYVRYTLKEMKKRYSQIDYAVVLPYLPRGKQDGEDYSDTMFPEGLESVHPQYAIDRRNKWMIDQSDFAVVYITHGWGGAVCKSCGASGKNGDQHCFSQ